MRFWQHRGIDGFRIDSLPTLLEEEHLADEPANPDWRDGVRGGALSLCAQRRNSRSAYKCAHCGTCACVQMDPHDAQLHINYTQVRPARAQRATNITASSHNYHNCRGRHRMCSPSTASSRGCARWRTRA
jgi:hypothetical protein